MIDPETNKEILNEVKAVTSEVYKDLAKPPVSEIGSVAGRTVKALLSPIRGFLWGWERIEKVVEEGVTKRLEKIPEERRKSPEPEIAVPLIQALSYTAQNETLREMYINLLANSMDTNKGKVVHPSFVEIIKQMNSLDAKLFDRLSLTNTYQKIVNPVIFIKGKKLFFKEATPEWYLGWTIEGFDEFDVSASIIRLNKFGLIDLMFDKKTENVSYDELKNTSFLLDRLNQFRIAKPDEDLQLGITKSIVYVNEYGIQFKSACK